LKELQSKSIVTDAFWYFVGAMIPMLVLFIRSPIYTRIFTPAEYGYYSLVNITFTYLSSLSFAWLTNCAWRYYLQYKNNNRIDNYNQILSVLFICSSIILFLISIIWVFITDNQLLRRLIIYGYIYFSTNELITFAVVPIRIEGKARKYNIINSARAIISFGLLLSLTFIAHIGIDAFFLAGAIVNLAFLLFIFLNMIFI
jgi:O-antigen/teichoic acid export membrane protein